MPAQRAVCRPGRSRLRNLFVPAVCVAALLSGAAAHAFSEHGPVSAVIMPRGDTIVIDYRGNDLDLELGGDWYDYQLGAHGQYVTPPRWRIANYFAQHEVVAVGGVVWPGRLTYVRQKMTTDPSGSTYEAVVRYRRPPGSPTPGPSRNGKGDLVIDSSLYSYDKGAEVDFQLGGVERMASNRRPGPIMFPGALLRLTLGRVLADYSGFGFDAVAGGICWLIALIIFLPRPAGAASIARPDAARRPSLNGEIQTGGQSVARAGLTAGFSIDAGRLMGVYVAGLVAGIGLGAIFGLHVDIAVCNILLTVAVAIAGVTNLLDLPAKTRRLVIGGASILAGVGIWYPGWVYGLVSGGRAFSVDALAIGAIGGGLLTGLIGLAVGLLLGRDVARRIRTHPHAAVNLNRILFAAAIGAAIYITYAI